MWLLAPALVGVLVLATFQVARRLGDGTMGLIAAALVATSGSLLYWGAGFMSDLPMTAIIVGSAAAVATSRSSAGTRSALLAVASGALLGVAFGVRPLTAICVAPIVLAVAILARAPAAGPSRPLPTMLVLMAAGGLPIVAGVLAYNHATNGSPLVFGYAQASGALHSLGFGLRGFVNYTSMGEPEISAEPFTPIQSLIGTGRQLASFSLGLLGGFFLPIFAAGVVLRTLPARAWLLVGVTALLPAVHVAWFFTDPRYYLPLIPFLGVAAAGVIESSTDAVGGGRTRLMALLAVCNLAQLISVMILDGYWGNPLARLTRVGAQFAAVEAARRQSDSTIVFVLDSGTAATTLWHLYPLNGERDPKRPIIVVRDRGSANAALTRQLTGWKAFCIDANRSEVVRPLRDGEEPTCRVEAASDGNGEKAK
jgi:4-amino-4-deoxy-L-arabinose transferase-like glycosyltransferase